MPYLGKSPSQGVRTRFQFTPNAGTTSISGADANGLTLSFTDGNYVDVYLNGVMLKAGVDYNTNTANTIAGLSATVASDVVDIVVYDTFSLFGGTLEGNVKVNNGTFNVTGAVDFDSTLNVDGVVTTDGATHDGDVTFTGANYNAVWDKSDNALEFGDNAKAKFGTGGDLEIYHNGSNSLIADVGTGTLILYGDTEVAIKDPVNGEAMATFIRDGAAELYHNNVKKIETTSSGVTVTGTTYSSLNLGIRISSPAYNLHVHQDDSDASYALFTNTTTGTTANDGFRIGIDSNEDALIWHREAENIIFATSNDEKMRIDSSGRVGINESNPASVGARLTVRGDAGANALFVGGNSTSGNSYGMAVNAGSNSSDASFRIYDKDGSTSYVYVRGDGNVGIGTTSPSFPLSVQADSNAEAILVLGRSSDDIGEIAFRENDNSTKLGELQYRQGYGILRHRVGYLSFETGGATERMRIDSSGNVIITDTSPTFNDTTKTVFRASGDNYVIKPSVCVAYNRTGSDGDILQFARTSSSVVGSISVNSSATAYNTSSDYRLKENVVTDWDATSRLKQLKPSRFNFKADKDTTVDGFLAHEVSSIVPEAVTGTKDEVDENGDAVMQGIDQSKLVPLLVKTIQELEARIAKLEGG